MEINYDYYRIFYYVAKYKSFTQAAHALLNNQPNITRSMNNLENQLGCQLFFRSNRGVELTPEGERLFSHVSIAFNQLQTAEMELSQNRELQGGVISIGVSSSALHEILLPKLARFRSLFPGIRLRLTSVSGRQAFSLLKKELADFALTDFSLDTSAVQSEASLKETALAEFQEILIASRQYAFLADRPRHLAELSDVPLITFKKTDEAFEHCRSFYQSLGMSLIPAVEVSESSQILALIEDGLGMGFLPRHLAQSALSLGTAVQIPLVEQLPGRRCSLIEDSSRSLSQPASQLIKLLLETEIKEK